MKLLIAFVLLLIIGGLATPKRERGAFWAALAIVASVGLLLVVRM